MTKYAERIEIFENLILSYKCRARAETTKTSGSIPVRMVPYLPTYLPTQTVVSGKDTLLQYKSHNLNSGVNAKEFQGATK